MLYRILILYVYLYLHLHLIASFSINIGKKCKPIYYWNSGKKLSMAGNNSNYNLKPGQMFYEIQL